MSYIFFSDTANYTKMVDSAQNSLNEVSPNYFALKNDGSLALTSSISPAFVTDMHARGIAVVPFLTNDWSRVIGKLALNNRQTLAKSLADAIGLYNLDGVNIDIENVTGTERSDYVDFVKILRELLGPDKTIVVSVAGNPWGWDIGWQGSYDYAGLCAYCDYLMVMCYDEHYYGGPAGPISSYSYLDKSMKYAVSVIPKEKVVLGLPFYGRIWANNGGFPNGYSLTNSRIAQIIKNYGGAVEYDAASRSTKAVITVGPGDTRLFVGGQALDTGTYTIWYENDQSIKNKLEFVNKYDIKGTGSWALGQESQNTWNYYKLWLNNCTFTDIETSWARDYILSAYLNHWITGFSADNFSPDEPLTRAQATVILVRKLGLVPVLDPAYRFDDCVGSWAEAYLETARKNHIVAGVGDNMFDPDRPITRQELSVMINSVIAYQNNADTHVSPDVTQISNPWSYNTVQTFSPGGVITGLSDGTYQACSVVTRADVTACIMKITASPPPADATDGLPSGTQSGDSPGISSTDTAGTAAGQRSGTSVSPDVAISAAVSFAAFSAIS